MKMNSLTRISLFSAMIAISVYIIPPIQIPMIDVSFTLQSMMVILIGFLLTPLEAFLSVLIYVLIGVAGLPVFSGARGGFTVLLGPSGGFIMMFPIISLFVSLFKSKDRNKIYDILIGVFFGIFILYAIANLYMSFVLSMNYWIALSSLLPFVPFDIFKIILAYIIYLRFPKELLK